MAQRRPIPVKIYSRNNRELPCTVGQVTRVDWDKVEKSKNAAKTFGTFIAIMCGSALIPFWHYFLVPSFFITACVMAMEKLNEGSRSEGGTGECPQCHQELKIEKSKWSERITDTCGACYCDLEIKLQTEDQ